MIHTYLNEASRVLDKIDVGQVRAVLDVLLETRERGGRLFLIGNGGGAGHASHAAADFRKIGRLEAYAWGENVSDLTAYVNDDGWACSVARWLADSRCGRNDCVLVFSVGGASDTVSENLKWAMSWAKDGPAIVGIVGAHGGEVARYATEYVTIPSIETPHVEGTQAVLWHLLVTGMVQC